MANPTVLSALARCFVSGEPTVDGIVARGSQLLGRNWRWLRPLARRFLETFAGAVRPREREVVEFFLRDAGFRRVRTNYLRVEHWLIAPPRMQSALVSSNWDIPAIETVGALAERLGITGDELFWFADLKGLSYKITRARLAHYYYRVLAKTSGAIRLIEAPKSRTKALQRRILSEILDKIPPHPAAHGFVAGRSVQTFIGPHLAQRVVLKMDLSDFFPSIAGVRVQTIFRMLGYPESVADLLGGICTNAVPPKVWNEAACEIDPRRLFEARMLYSRPHLPQGAPTSPALANICAYRADCRLAGLAAAAGAQYSRYADDLAFSGGEDFERAAERFSTHAAAILLEEGFAVNQRKMRIMRQGVRQRLAGVVANQHANVPRPDFDRLKATLHNCVRLGPETQNRTAHPRFRAHLDGRVGWVESLNPAKGRRLRVIFERVAWESPGG
jgi:RNA-directed DNA polymerase